MSRDKNNKTLIIYRVNRSNKSNIGVVNKLVGQVEGLYNNNCKVDFIIHDDNNIYLNYDVFYSHETKTENLKFKWHFFDFLKDPTLLEYDTYIVRYGLTTPSFLRWLKYIRNQNKSAKIVIDMPTYPYKLEWKGIYGRLALMADRFYSKRLQKYVHAVLHSGKEPSIFNIPVIPFSNGIRVYSYKCRNPIKHKGYILLAVGKWQYWHGLDRVIQGLKDYKNKRKKGVQFIIVGDGPILNNLKDLVKSNLLEDVVLFKGVCKGEELDRLFDTADIGIGTLGLYRKKVIYDSSLKHREYMVRGLPFVLSSQDSDIPEELNCVFKIPSDDSPLNIDKLITDFNRLDIDSTILNMNKFAINNLSWSTKMKDLMSSIR